MTAATGFAGRYSPQDHVAHDGHAGHAGYDEARTEATLRRLRKLAFFLDTAVTLPGGFRFGADTLIGFAPGIGDLATTLISCYFVYEGKRLGLPNRAVAAMAGNVALNLALGATPVLGDVADTWFKANVRNLAIIEKHVGRGRTAP